VDGVVVARMNLDCSAFSHPPLQNSLLLMLVDDDGLKMDLVTHLHVKHFNLIKLISEV